VDLKETVEFQTLLSTGADLTKRFIAQAVRDGRSGDLDFVVRFIVLLTTSFAERTTDQGTGGAELIRQADLLTDMLVAKFNIA
jgi:hypothetical protein